MGEKESNSTTISLQGKERSYHKIGNDQRNEPHFPYIESDDIQSSAIDLEWDMETELEELGIDHFQSDGFTQQHNKNQQTQASIIASSQPSISPKGRFQRLEEEPEYFSHYSDAESKKTPKSFCRIIKMFLTFLCIFILGILLGYFSKRSPCSLSTDSTITNEPVFSSEMPFIDDILNSITKENIEKHYRYFSQISINKTDLEAVNKIALLWTSMGLKEVQLVNYSVLLDLPGSSPNTITLNNGQCYYPNGQQCDEESKKHPSQESLYSYAAYSARGTLEGEIIDVQYGTVDDLWRIKQTRNVTNQIALLKLGVLPLLYKISLLEEFGFGGALIYVEPCDQPENAIIDSKSFMVSLNNGEGLSTSDYSAMNGSLWKVKTNFTSLLVQPVAVSLLKTLFSLPEDTRTEKCSLIKISETEIINIRLTVQSKPTYKDISNAFGILRGSILPDRYIIVGSPHTIMYGQEWASGAAIMASIIESIVFKTKEGWRPNRTILFCSWGGTTFGNIGSYKWAEDFGRILESNAVAYIGLQNPIRGNTRLHVIASPSLQQLAVKDTKKMLKGCTAMKTCHIYNVSTVQMPGDADFFIHHLGIPAAQFVFEDSKSLEASNSEAIFITEEKTSQDLSSLFHLHESIAKLSSEMVLQIASEPVLPFNALDVALEIQNSIEGDVSSDSVLMEKARSLRDIAQWFQSNEMRPANDPKERDPIRVRMLNDILQNLEKNFLVKKCPPGFPRNILYKLDEKTTRFSILQEAQEHCKIYKSNETLLAALQEVLNCISSAQLYFKESLHVFEDGLGRND